MATDDFSDQLTSGAWVEGVRWVVHAVAGEVLLGSVGGVDGGVTAGAVQLELPVLALLADGVHLGQEDRGEQEAGDGHDRHRYRRVVEGGRGEVEDQRPSDKNWDQGVSQCWSEDRSKGHLV